MGVLVPIPKGDKDRTVMDNNRGITLMTTVRKVFEKAVLEKISKWVKNGHIIHDLQGAGQEHCSSLETNWLVRESISYYLEQGSDVYVCMMDVRKAFDTVWQNGLFYKLYYTGMDPKIWGIITKLYSKFDCCVRVGDHISDWFTARQGIIQGGPFSMFNFQIMNNDLLSTLKSCHAGTVIGSLNTTSPAFADDLTILAPTRAGLQRLLNKTFDHSCLWRYEFNAKKCAIVVYGRNGQVSPFKFGDKEIRVVSGHEHVGTLLSPSKWDTVHVSYVKKRVNVCNKPGYAIMSIGSSSAPMTPVSASKLYWSVCIPKLTYGLHLMDIPNEATQSLESYHAKFAKVFQGLPDQASNLGAVACMGWMSVEGYINMMLLLYVMRIIRLSTDCIYKKIFLVRYCYHMYNQDGPHYGPLSRFISLCKEYRLITVLKEAVEQCNIPSKIEWKRIVMENVWHTENQKFNIMSTIYKSLSQFSHYVKGIKLLSWWRFAQLKTADVRKCKSIARLLLDCHGLKVCQYRYKQEGINSYTCDWCNTGQAESISHVLFDCEEFHTIRADMWQRVLETCPNGLRNELIRMNSEQLTTLIITGYCDSFTIDWIPLFSETAAFIEKMYSVRVKSE